MIIFNTKFASCFTFTNISDLKKVTSEMQTHKNPNLRTGPAPFKAPATANSGSPMKNTLPANAPIDKPPVFTRDGKKWLVVCNSFFKIYLAFLPNVMSIYNYNLFLRNTTRATKIYSLRMQR